MSYDPYNTFLAAPVNNAGLDPVQGFDVEVWAQDTASGKLALFGRFQTITLSVRDATETYLELGQRIPTYLNGEIQIAWVLEQGLLDMDFLTRTFGVREMQRGQFITRGPRFHITYDVNAAELDLATSTARTDLGAIARNGVSPENASLFNQNLYNQESDRGLRSVRQAQGRIELVRCKVDSVSMGTMAGRRVSALRWEGVCEGYRVVTGNNSSLQQYKTQRLSSSSLPQGNAQQFGAQVGVGQLVSGTGQ